MPAVVDSILRRDRRFTSFEVCWLAAFKDMPSTYPFHFSISTPTRPSCRPRVVLSTGFAVDDYGLNRTIRPCRRVSPRYENDLSRDFDEWTRTGVAPDAS